MYKEFHPHPSLQPYIDAFWTLNSVQGTVTSEVIMPDGCIDIIVNLGNELYTDDGKVRMDHRHAYLVGTMTRYKKITRPSETNLIGIRFKPGAFSYFYDYPFLKEIVNKTAEFEKHLAPDIDKITNRPIDHLNYFFFDRLSAPKRPIVAIIADIYKMKGQVKPSDLARRHFIPDRRLERLFMSHLGISPKEFINFVRYLFAFQEIKRNTTRKSLLHIAFDNGYYDHAHLSNEIKKYTGLAPSQL
jgi:AraC-like DNA-binding protein